MLIRKPRLCFFCRPSRYIRCCSLLLAGILPLNEAKPSPIFSIHFILSDSGCFPYRFIYKLQIKGRGHLDTCVQCFHRLCNCSLVNSSLAHCCTPVPGNRAILVRACNTVNQFYRTRPDTIFLTHNASHVLVASCVSEISHGLLYRYKTQDKHGTRGRHGPRDLQQPQDLQQPRDQVRHHKFSYLTPQRIDLLV